MGKALSMAKHSLVSRIRTNKLNSYAYNVGPFSEGQASFLLGLYKNTFEFRVFFIRYPMAV